MEKKRLSRHVFLIFLKAICFEPEIIDLFVAEYN